MSDGAQPGRAYKITRYAQATFLAHFREHARVHPLRVDLERDDVRDNALRVDAHSADAREAVCESLRVAVVFDEPVAHLLERDERGGRDHAGLPHRPAEQLAHATRLRDGLRRPTKDRSDRRGEALREAELDRVHGRAELAG